MIRCILVHSCKTIGTTLGEPSSDRCFFGGHYTQPRLCSGIKTVFRHRVSLYIANSLISARHTHPGGWPREQNLHLLCLSMPLFIRKTVLPRLPTARFTPIPTDLFDPRGSQTGLLRTVDAAFIGSHLPFFIFVTWLTHTTVDQQRPPR